MCDEAGIAGTLANLEKRAGRVVGATSPGAYRRLADKLESAGCPRQPSCTSAAQRRRRRSCRCCRRREKLRPASTSSHGPLHDVRVLAPPLVSPCQVYRLGYGRWLARGLGFRCKRRKKST